MSLSHSHWKELKSRDIHRTNFTLHVSRVFNFRLFIRWTCIWELHKNVRADECCCVHALSMPYSSYSAAKNIESMRDCLSVDSPPNHIFFSPFLAVYTHICTQHGTPSPLNDARRIHFSRLYAGRTHVCMHTYSTNRISCALRDFFVVVKICTIHTCR